VYWDLPGAVEETNTTGGMASSRTNTNRSGAGNMKFTLQTIHQKVSQVMMHYTTVIIVFSVLLFQGNIQYNTILSRKRLKLKIQAICKKSGC